MDQHEGAGDGGGVLGAASDEGEMKPAHLGSRIAVCLFVYVPTNPHHVLLSLCAMDSL